MKVFSVLGFSPWWGTSMPPNVLDLDDPKLGTVGGGEEAGLQTAAGLAALGHDVTLYWCGLPGEWRGVKFRSDRDPLSPVLVADEPDAIICWSTILPFQFKSEKTVCLLAQQLNDLWSPGNWDLVDCIVSPSKSHAKQLHRWGWWKGEEGDVARLANTRPWHVVHNGLDAAAYGAPRTMPGGGTWFPPDDRGPPAWNKRSLNVGYWSSPDRGLHHLLEAWPKVTAAEPSARLHIFYEVNKWFDSGSYRCLGSYGDLARRMYRDLVPRAKADPTITWHGAVPRKVLAKTQVQCRVMCYPYDPIEFCEGFGGSVNQAIAACCHVLLGPHDAFPSLYNGAVTWLPSTPTEMREKLPSEILKALKTPPPEKAEAARFKFTWERAAKEMERAINRDWDCLKESLES